MTSALLQVDIASLITENAQKVFSVMLGVEISPRSAAIHEDSNGPAGDVVSLVGFVGQWAGTGSLSSNSEVACKISQQMVGTEFNTVNEEVLDAFGEVTNMIVGNLKNAIEPVLGPLGLSTPTVIQGERVRARNLNGQLWTTVSFNCLGGVLDVKVSLRPVES
jgi:chemotaxis protein CheX